MKKALTIAAVVLLAAVLGFAAYAAYFLRSLDTPEVQKALLDRVSATLGAEVRVKTMEVSLLSGIQLEGVTIANPAPFRGELLTADAFVLRYRLLPLLRGRLEVQRLALARPRLRVVSSRSGGSNVERLLAKPPANPHGAPATSSRLPLRLVLSRLAATNGAISAVDHAGAPLVEIDNAELSSGFELSPEGLRGSGKASLGRVRLRNGLSVRDASAELKTAGRELRLSPIRGRLAEGDLTGEVTVSLADQPYTARIQVKGAQLKALLEETRAPRRFSGKLEAQASLEGMGGVPTLKGKGQAHVSDCRVEEDKLLTLVAVTLGVPELAHPDLDECKVEFSLARSVVTNPVVSLKGPAFQLTGHGTTHLETHALDYQMNLALAMSMLERVPAKEMRAAFVDRGDGFAAMDFNVSGTSNAPQTDLLARIGKAAATEAAKGGLRKLLDKFRKRS